VYAVPLLNPLTVIGLDEPVPVAPPGEAVTVYEVIGSLENEGAVNATETAPPVVKSLAESMLGAEGEPLVALDDEVKIGIKHILSYFGSSDC
jgi:hypothetical protein